MTHIEQMILDLCPNGVEWKQLGEVTYWDKRFNEVDRSMQPQIRKYHYYLANELEELESPIGTIKILYTSNKIAYAEEETVAENVVDAEVVAIPWGGNANVKYFNGKFITADNRIAVVRDSSVLSTKFVYYWLMKNQSEIDSYYRGAGIKHPSMLKVLSLEIPIPPLEIQKKIVECLDKFSALAAELQAELQKRRKQYEYYRTRLLTPPQNISSDDSTDERNWEWKTLGEIAQLGTGSHNTQDGLTEGHYPFYTRGTEVLRLNTYEFDETAIITAGDGAGVGKVFHYVEGKYALHQRAYRIIPKNEILLPRFLYHYMRFSFYAYIMKNSVSSSVTSVRKPMLEAYPIPLPPLKEQKRIADLLDKFEALTTSLTDGIPAEQAAQQKRYEYYRDKLLTFERKAV